MGEALTAFFTRAEKVGGLRAKVRLAELTQVPSMTAAILEDRPDLIARFNSALREVIDELSAEDGILAPSTTATRWDACIDLLIQRDRYVHSRKTTAEFVTERTTRVLGVPRASIWYLSDDGEALTCIDAFDAGSREHTSGTRLEAKDYAPYFEAIRKEHAVAVSNAGTDPRTACLLQSYLKPHGIWSRLDTPIWSRGALYGVLCSEHPKIKAWSSDEREYALFLGQIVALGEELRAGVHATPGA